MKIVINTRFGGFGLSDEAMLHLAALKGLNAVKNTEFGWSYFEVNGEPWSANDLSRTDPELVRAVEELGSRANGLSAALLIVELSTGQRYRIVEYDGSESIETPEDIAWQVA